MNFSQPWEGASSMKESSSEPTKDDRSCAEPRLMPTLVAPGGLIVCLEMPRMTHLGHFSDVAVLDGNLDSKLVAGAGQRFESARRLCLFPAKSVNYIKE